MDINLIGSCTCLSKSPEYKEHEEGCVYRILSDPDINNEKKEIVASLKAGIDLIQTALIQQSKVAVGDVLLESHLISVLQDINKAILMVVNGGYNEL